MKPNDTSDIVERLRADAQLLTEDGYGVIPLTLAAAADEIESLRADVGSWTEKAEGYARMLLESDDEIERLRAALKRTVPLSKDGRRVFVEGSGDCAIDFEHKLD